MKKMLSLLIAAALLLSLCAVPATAANGPMPTDPESWGGARIGFSAMDEAETAYVVKDLGEGLVINNSAYPGAGYDRASNTLTLNSVDAADCSLFIWYMGDDFKLNIVGSCAVGVIYVSNQFGFYNTNLHITGDGTLTVNESRQCEASIFMFADGENCATLSADASVTLHLYGAGNDGLIINNYGTTAGTGAEAISVGGEGIDGVVGERIFYTEFDEANLMFVRNRTEQYTDGYVAKSKSDPDGKYSVSWWEEDGSRYVKHYVYAPELGLWVVDQNFGEWSGSTSSYTKEAFDREYTIEQSEQPVRIRYTDDEREQHLGYEVLQFAKAGEPGVVFGGSGSWRSPDADYSKPEGYQIFRLNWDEAKGVYLKDESDDGEWVAVDELESSSWSIVTRTETVQKTLDVYSNPAPYNDNNILYYGDVYRNKSTGDEYIKSGTYTNDADSGVILRRIRYDAVNDAFYSQGEADRLLVSTKSTAGDALDDLYEPVTEEITEPVKLRYITSYYGFDDYSTAASLVQRTNDTTPYSVEESLYNGETYYTVHKLELRENGHYYAVKWRPDDSSVYGRGMSPEEFAAEGYSLVTSAQDTPFTHVGQVDFFTVQKYTDAGNHLYGVDWETVYSYSEDGLSLTFGDTTYYSATPSSRTKDELISSEREIETAQYHYSLKGDAYHHEGIAGDQSFLLGDADGDGEVTILDATAIQRKLAKLSTKAFHEKPADADEDGGVTILDATAIQRYRANLHTHEGIGVKRV